MTLPPCERCHSPDARKSWVILKDKSILLCVVCEECELCLKNMDPEKINIEELDS